MNKEPHLGDVLFEKKSFEGLEASLAPLQKPEFAKLPDDKKIERISEILYSFLKQAQEPSFLFGELIDFLTQIEKKGIHPHYHLSHFELWLISHSGLSSEENRRIRAKIFGRMVPREAYQVFFPVGMNKVYEGPHFVCAHSSPDLDTTVASFWGWVDSFSARVTKGLHLWNLPGGPPQGQVEINFLFHELFGASVFSFCSIDRSTLELSSLELMNTGSIVKKLPNESTLSIDGKQDSAASIVVDHEGFYLGQWSSEDAEGVHQIVMLLSTLMLWFESEVHFKLISLFASEKVTKDELSHFASTFLKMKLDEMPPAANFTSKQKKQLQDCLVKVFNLPDGISSTVSSFAKAVDPHFNAFSDLDAQALFDKSGKIIENRTVIFFWFEKVVHGLKEKVLAIRDRLNDFSFALNIKAEVFNASPSSVSFRSHLEEIKNKMGFSPYLTVTSANKEGRLSPLGVIHVVDLYKPTLGTVTLRDFSNREETKIPPYLEIISFIDHHKMALTTDKPIVASLSDAQSSNSLTAALSMSLNDRFGSSGMTLSEINEEIDSVKQDLSTNEKKRVLVKLLQKQVVLEKKSSFYIDPKREFVEYLHYLFAILDDTDLLTKVSPIDVEVICSLLNRMKSLQLKKEVEVISFDEIPMDQNFATVAAAKLLKSAEMYSLYSKIYALKEKSIEENLKAAAEKTSQMLFADTKVQNGIARVGQIKLFPRNYPSFSKVRREIRTAWCEEAQLFSRERREVDFHLQMISTIEGAEELYHGKTGGHSHRDELWIYAVEGQSGIGHLKNFLNAFSSAPHIDKIDVQVEFLGDNAMELDAIFTESFLSVARKVIHEAKSKLPIAVLTYKAGSVNSRKAMITPFLPK